MPFPLASPFSIRRFNFFCLQVLLTRASLLALAKSIYYILLLTADHRIRLRSSFNNVTLWTCTHEVFPYSFEFINVCIQTVDFNQLRTKVIHPLCLEKFSSLHCQNEKENQLITFKPRSTNTRLIRTPNYYGQLSLSLRKESLYIFSKFNPLNTDTLFASTQDPGWWRSGDSTRLPPMWPGFESWRRRHMWVAMVVGSLLCSERFFSSFSGFPLSIKTNAFKLHFHLERTDTFQLVVKNSLVLRG